MAVQLIHAYLADRPPVKETSGAVPTARSATAAGAGTALV
jgi:hypothetical protein